MVLVSDVGRVEALDSPEHGVLLTLRQLCHFGLRHRHLICPRPPLQG